MALASGGIIRWLVPHRLSEEYGALFGITAQVCYGAFLEQSRFRIILYRDRHGMPIEMIRKYRGSYIYQYVSCLLNVSPIGPYQ